MLAALAAAVAAGSALADPPPPQSNLAAVERAYVLIERAAPSDRGPADQAIRVLTNATGDTQPEILQDLRAKPPLYDDARTRLSALATALRDPMTTSDPDLAQQRLHEILASSR